jgi:paraquat-inducible protein B
MSTKPHYFRIGIFVILAAALILAAVVVFGAGLLARNKLYFETYFDESITGLTVGSPIEFRGVRIGLVEKVGFVGSEYKIERAGMVLSRYEPYVRVVFSIPQENLPEFAKGQIDAALQQMVGQGLRARITSNILTGQAYLELNYLDPNRFDVMKIAWTPKYPYVPSAPGELTTLKDSLDQILQRLHEIDFEGLVDTFQQVLTSVNQGIADANLGELSREAKGLLKETRQKVAALETEKINEATQELLASLNAAAAEAQQKVAALDTRKINQDLVHVLTSVDRAVAEANIPELSRDTQSFLAEIRATNEHLQKLLAAPEAVSGATNVPEAVARLNSTLTRLDRLMATERPEIEIILANFRELSDTLRELVATLKAHPSELLFSKPPPRSEVLK